MKLRILIAEDEPLCRERLKRFLETEPQAEIVAECATGHETLQAIQQNRPDVMFLDVRMPDLDGFAVIEALRGTGLPVIIFVTAHDRFAVRAFEVHAADYLLKPFDQERLQTALQRARERVHRHAVTEKGPPLAEMLATLETCLKPLERLTIRSQGRIAIVNTREVDWVSAADNYVELHVGDATHLLRTTITALASQLPRQRFARISRSLLVNVDRIKEIRPKTHGDYDVLLQNGTRLGGSRTYRGSLTPFLANSR